jgi:penicillin G amidase
VISTAGLVQLPIAGEEVAAPITDRPDRLTDLLTEHSLRFVFADPAVYRLVVEPDIANHRAVARMRQLGFVCGPIIDLPEKTAQLAFLTRDRWVALYGE